MSKITSIFRALFGFQKKKPNSSEDVALQVGEVSMKINRTWYRGEHTNYHPVKASLLEADAIERYVGKGWLPANPIVDKKKYITAFGSCFASHVTKFLHKEGYRVFGRDLKLDAHIVRSGDGIVNSAALLQQFQWAYTDWRPQTQIWHDTAGEAGDSSSKTRTATREIFAKTDVFIFTLGLSEVWYDKITGDLFWRAIPRTQFDPERHGFRLVGSDENKQNLTEVYRLIRTHRPEAEIIFTLSPIPLAATFRPVSCITANSVSKASLRLAIDELMREFSDDPKLHYFPSYEIVTGFFADPMQDDLRHPRAEVVNTIMDTFKRSYLC